jgi:hypothetical protein
MLINYFIYTIIMQLPILLGLFSGIITCLYVEIFIKTPTLSNFIEPYILYGMIYFLIVFIYLTIKVFHKSFILRYPFEFFIELFFIGVFSYLFFIMIYYFRGLPLKRDHSKIVYFAIVFVIIHVLLELSGMYIVN